MDIHQKIKVVQDKWRRITKDINDAKVNRSEVLQQKLANVEQLVGTTMEFKHLQLAINELSAKQLNETTTDQLEQRLSKLSGQLKSSLEQNELDAQRSEVKLYEVFENHCQNIENTITRNAHAYRTNVSAKLDEVASSINEISEQIVVETSQRQQSMTLINDALTVEFDQFRDYVIVERKVREETSLRIFQMIEDCHSRLQGLMTEERKQRVLTTTRLFELLENACIRIDQNLA